MVTEEFMELKEMLKNKTLERIAHCWNEATLCFPLCHCAQDLELRKRGGGKGGREEKGREHVFSGRDRTSN